MRKPFLVARVEHTEENGSVTVFEQGTLPFGIRRTFLVRANSGQLRGAHAHRECWQALFSLSGRIEVTATHGGGSESHSLFPDGDGLVIPPMVWATQRYFGADASLLVLCSHEFDEADYIRTLSDFERSL